MVRPESDSVTRYHSLRQLLAERLAGGFVYEPSGCGPIDPQRPDERIVQAIWNEQLLDGTRLTTCSGKRVRVIEPGRWNGEAGPDFRMAELEIDGARLRGDVEVHMKSADWERHRHERDFDYNNVVLHAFLELDDAARYDTVHNGNRIERIHLRPVLQPDLPTICQSMSGEEFVKAPPGVGRCHSTISRLHPDEVDDFLRSAARQRMEQKVSRLEAQSRSESPDQVFYQAIMTAMGYKGGKTLFFLLARRTPIEELKTFLRAVPQGELALALEAVLLNVASLVPAPPEGAEGAPCSGAKAFDADTQAYLNRLNRWWTELAGYYQDRIIPPTRRWFAGVRPVNFPTRRIAGVSCLLAGADFRRGLVERFAGAAKQAMERSPKMLRDFRREIQQLSAMFSADGSSYWRDRYTFGGTAAKRPMQLIGDERAASVFLNALLPMLILRARTANDARFEEFLWRLFEHFPALEPNVVTRYMQKRLFGEKTPAFINIRLEKYSQGLFHIFSDCCNNNLASCDDCRVTRLQQSAEHRHE